MICPVCGNTIDAEFGVVTCGQCQSVLFVDIEGNIQVNSAPSESPQNFQSSEEPQKPSSAFQDYSSEIVTPDLGEVPVQSFDMPAVEQEIAPVAFEESVADAYTTAMSSPPEPIAAADLDSEPEVTRTIAQEIESFANSEVSNLGALSYSVIISGIDTKELRQELQSVLSEPKYMLDWRPLMESIREGEIVIRNLNPVKTSRLVMQLSYLSLQVSWRQNVFGS